MQRSPSVWLIVLPAWSSALSSARFQQTGRPNQAVSLRILSVSPEVEYVKECIRFRWHLVPALKS